MVLVEMMVNTVHGVSFVEISNMFEMQNAFLFGTEPFDSSNSNVIYSPALQKDNIFRDLPC